MSLRWLVFSISLFILYVFPAVAIADPRDPVAAEALFAEARQLMSTGAYDAACPKFLESQSLDPAPGTALNLAVCYEKAGKRASAWAAYKTAASSALSIGQRARGELAKKKVALLEPTLSRVTVTVPSSARIPGLEIRYDGELLDLPVWGTAVPRDGGGHDIEARAPGRKVWRSHIDLQNSGQSLEIDVPTLEALPVAAPVAVDEKATAAPPPPAVSTPEIAPTSKPSRVQHVAGFVTGGVGLAGIAFGAFAGIDAASKYHDAKTACGGGTVCAPGSQGLELRSSASSWAAISTVAFAAGGALLATGAVLVFTAPHRSTGETAVDVGTIPRGAEVSVVGSFE